MSVIRDRNRHPFTIMDVAYFLRERVEFIRQFYNNGSEAFIQRKVKIENEEEPFVPPYSENGEPPFLAEWQEADDSLQVLGYTCLSMLSASLKLYFSTVDRIYGFSAWEACKGEFKKGFICGYRAFFETALDIDFGSAPCDLKLLEEVVLIRNDFEHPSEIVFQRIAHPSAAQKSPSMFFCNELERAAWDDLEDKESSWLLFPPSVHVEKEGLFEALEEVSRFCEWLEDQLTKWRHGLTNSSDAVMFDHIK